MTTYTVDTASGELIIEADDFTVGEGLVVFRDVAGLALVAVPTATIRVIRCAYDPADELLAARQQHAATQRAAHVEALLSPPATPNRVTRRKATP